MAHTGYVHTWPMLLRSVPRPARSRW